MCEYGRLLCMLVGVVLGGVGMTLFVGRWHEARAGATDHSGDFILCTGSVTNIPGIPTDGVWLLDYRTGELLATMIDRNTGKTMGWAQVNLLSEFGLHNHDNAHFLMTTGIITENQAALYVAETTSGKFGIYTMARRVGYVNGMVIKRHEISSFRVVKNG